MTWMMSRMGSRFSLTFEPYRRQVLHSALGRFQDQPLDLEVGMIEPDGTRRVLPFTQADDCTDLYNCEQFERMNSLTFRGFSERYHLRFELNIHSVFYPQDEQLCIMPAFYMEMRIHPVPYVRWEEQAGPSPEQIRLFIRLRRPDTEITASSDAGDGDNFGQIDLRYRNLLAPDRSDIASDQTPPAPDGPAVDVCERIVSLNPGCQATEQGDGLMLDLPVTDEGSGVKWRFVWATHVAEPVIQVGQGEDLQPAKFRYTRHWRKLEKVLKTAIANRDDWLAKSRRFEKVLDQASMHMAQFHLLHQAYQNWAANAFWCDIPQEDGTNVEWFSVMEGSSLYHSSVDVEYNNCLLYLTLWPDLLRLQLRAWGVRAIAHEKSGGAFISHDMGAGSELKGRAFKHEMQVEETCNYLLMLQAYTHWTRDTAVARIEADRLEELVRYLIWTDRDDSGFPSSGVANTLDRGIPAVQYSRKQVYLGVKRVAGLRAAADLLGLAEHKELARTCDALAESDARKIEHEAWLGDHYAICVDKSAIGLMELGSDKPLFEETLEGWDAYSISTGNGLLLPTIIGQPPILDPHRLKKDLAAATRENFSRYGCGHTSEDPEDLRISQNLWRDHLAHYMEIEHLTAQPYWDMQVMSNTGAQSLGFVDTYIRNHLAFYPRGATAFGYLLCGPRLVIDRLAPGGTLITVTPDRHRAQRWPLFPLADWKVGKVPVCVVDPDGHVTIESQLDPVIIHGQAADEVDDESDMIG